MRWPCVGIALLSVLLWAIVGCGGAGQNAGDNVLHLKDADILESNYRKHVESLGLDLEVCTLIVSINDAMPFAQLGDGVFNADYVSKPGQEPQAKSVDRATVIMADVCQPIFRAALKR